MNDVIFLGEAGFTKAIASWLQQNASGIVVVWFQDGLGQLRHALGNIPGDKFVLAYRLTNTPGNTAPVLFAGHYPLRAAETDLCDRAGAKEMLVYSHLDMPLFRKFGSDKVKGMMVSMGMNEDEPLTHPLITKSIGNAQEKIEKKCITDMHAQSEEDWFRMNLPEL
ncbi:MAG: hypothetical protein K0Q79_1204 [Flavipsychrobacter sp.]|nr:hypothetical protein [Flavipsychrobacter sp.]